MLGALAAQEPGAGTTPTPPPPVTAPPPARTLVLQNLAPFPRREGAAVVVPFAPGAVSGVPDLHVKDTPTAWQPFGARWPDGSVRQALCLFTTQIGALQEVIVPLEAGPGPELPTGDIVLPAATIEFVVTQQGQTIRAVPERVSDLEHNALRRVELRRARIGETGLVAELLVTGFRDQAHAAVDAAVFFSDPRTPAMQCNVDELAIECRGMTIVFRHAGRLGVTQQLIEGGSRSVLLQRGTLGDGQGLRRTGALLPPAGGSDDSTSRAAAVAPLLGATTWQDSGAFGAFGRVPDVPPWLQGAALRNHFALRHRAFADGERPGGDPFAVFPHGLAKNAGQSGDQVDFGTVKLCLVAASGLPSMLLEVEVSVLQEACRPVHCFEPDGSPVDPAKHPEWVVWSGRTHWHAGVSKDRLGKPVPEPQIDTHGWYGKDREHWSNNYLGAFALLTGSHWARRELENEVRLYLSGQTVDPQFSTSGAGAPRGAGRVALSSTWMLLATGDEALLRRINERVDRVYFPQWAGRELAPTMVRPMAVAPPDARMVQGAGPYWNPWQDALAAVGFAAVHRVTGNANARTLAEQLAINVVRYGWQLGDNRCQIATAMRWFDGKPLSDEQIASGDPTLVQWADGTAFAEWAVASCEIARVAAEAAGDKAVAERAAAIQARVRATRRAPPPGSPDAGGLDRLSEWDAVRWDAR